MKMRWCLAASNADQSRGGVVGVGVGGFFVLFAWPRPDQRGSGSGRRGCRGGPHVTGAVQMAGKTLRSAGRGRRRRGTINSGDVAE